MIADESPARVGTSTDALADLRRSIISTTRRLTTASCATGVALTPGIGPLLCLGAARWVAREQPLRTYAVVYGERDPFREFALQVAEYFGTDHQEIGVGADAARSALSDLVWQTEHPLAAESLLDHLLMAREAAGEVDLLLNGDICFTCERPEHAAHYGWPLSRWFARSRAFSDVPLSLSPSQLRDLSSLDRLHARAGVSGAALFHDAEVRTQCRYARVAMQRVYAGNARTACALGAGFVPARLLEAACQPPRRANESFWRSMRDGCKGLLGDDAMSVRETRRWGTGRGDRLVAPSAGSPARGLAYPGRCLPSSEWSRVILELWSRVFVDGPLREERTVAGASGQLRLAPASAPDYRGSPVEGVVL